MEDYFYKKNKLLVCSLLFMALPMALNDGDDGICTLSR